MDKMGVSDGAGLELLMNYEDIIIYGAGKIGTGLLSALSRLGLREKVRCFARTDKNFGPYCVAGVEVKSVYALTDFYQSAIFLLAVGEKLMPEICMVVEELKIRNYRKMSSPYTCLLTNERLNEETGKEEVQTYLREQNEGNSLFFKGMTATHITYSYVCNAGDTVLSWAVRQFLGFGGWNIRSVSDAVSEREIRDFNRTDAVIVGGGGLFLPDTNPNSISGWQWAISDRQIEELNVPLILFSVGYNYFRHQIPTARFLNSLNCVAKKSVFFGLRNMGSVETVKGLLDAELREKVVYQPCTTTLIRKMYELPAKKKAKRVALNMAFDREEQRFEGRQEQIFEQIYQAILAIHRFGYEVVYVAHSDKDLKFLLHMNEKNMFLPFVNLEKSLPDEVIRFYRNVDVAIGMRGHAQMIPFGVGTKIISLGTHDKMKWFLEDVNLKKCYVDLNENIAEIAEQIVGIFTEIEIKKPKETDAYLRAEQERLWNISCANRSRLLSVLSK